MASEHTAKAFDSDLQELTRLVAEMGGLAERMIVESVDALIRRDVPLGQSAHLGDKPGQFLQVTIEGLGGVFKSHVRSPRALARQPKRPVM